MLSGPTAAEMVTVDTTTKVRDVTQCPLALNDGGAQYSRLYRYKLGTVVVRSRLGVECYHV